MKPRVGPCESLCDPPVGWMASVHLQGGETRCWGLCARLCRGTVFAWKYRASMQTRLVGRRDSSPSLSMVLLSSVQRIFRSVCVWQNAQGKGNADGSKKERDKAVISPSPTPARSAGRKLRKRKDFGLS